MVRIKIGNDIKIEYSVFRNTEPEDFSEITEISVVLKNLRFPDVEIKPAYTIEGNVIKVSFPESLQTNTGVYRLEVKYKKINLNLESGESNFSVDQKVFELVEYTENQGGVPDTNLGILIPITGVVEQNKDGINGANAFELWQAIPGNELLTDADYFLWLQKPAKDAADLLKQTDFTYEDGKLFININI